MRGSPRGNRNPLEGDPNDAAASPEPCHKARNFTGHKFWARGYFVSTVERDEEMIRAYIKNQEMQDRELDQLSMIP